MSKNIRASENGWHWHYRMVQVIGVVRLILGAYTGLIVRIGRAVIRLFRGWGK